MPYPATNSSTQLVSIYSFFPFHLKKKTILIQLEAFLPLNIMSTTIAIAGGSGNVGRTISDALVAAAKHKVIVLAREVKTNHDSSSKLSILKLVLTYIYYKTPKDWSPSDPPLIKVDYNDINAVTHILETHNVHTVISTISVITPESGAAERNLVNAASKAAPTKRFIQSDWGVLAPSER